MTHQVEHLPPLNETMQRLHQLGDGSGIVPPVNIVQINVGRSETLKRDIDVEMHRLQAVAIEEVLLLDGSGVQVRVIRVLVSQSSNSGSIGRKKETDLGRNEKLVTDTPFFSPLSNEFFRLAEGAERKQER